MSEFNMKLKDYKNLVKFLKFFINRPNHLAKFLIDNNVLDKEFLKKLPNLNSSSMNESEVQTTYFTNIDQMNTYFSKLIENKKNTSSEETLIEELQIELERCILEERYEDAIRIRDYLKKNQQKKN